MENINLSTNEILVKRFSQLPEIIQKIILESNWKDVLRRITATYKLHIDQGGYLEAITLLTMLGLEDSDKYIKNLEKEVKITNVLATEIAKKVEVEIFQKIRETVMKEATKDKDSKEEIKPKIIDPYREQVSDVEILEEEKDEKINNKEEIEKGLHQTIDIIDEYKDSNDIEIIDREKAIEEIEGPNLTNIPKFTPKTNTDLQKEIDLGTKIDSSPKEYQKPKPIHMRTLKSDIVKQKLSNPSWVPKITKREVVSNQTKNIINDAKKELNDNINI